MHFAAHDLVRRENDDGARDGEEVLGKGAVPLAVRWCEGGRDVP